MTTRTLPSPEEYDYVTNIQGNARRDYAAKFDLEDASPYSEVTVTMPTPIGLLGCAVYRKVTVSHKGTRYTWATSFTLDDEPRRLSELAGMGLVPSKSSDVVADWLARRIDMGAGRPGENTITTTQMYEDFLGWAAHNGVPASFTPPANTFSQRLKGLGVDLRRRSYGTIAPSARLLPVPIEKPAPLYNRDDF